MAADTGVSSPAMATEVDTARPAAVLGELMRTSRRSLAGWGIALTAVVGIYLAFYPAIGAEQMDQMAAILPDDLASALGYDDLGDPAGYLTATVYALLGPALLLVFCIGLGARVLAGKEEEGTLELELTSAVPRRTVYLERLAALWAQTALLALVLFVVTMLLVLALDLEIGIGGVAAGTAGLLVFVLAHGTLAFAVGAATGRRTLGLTVGAAVAVLGYVGDAIGRMVEAAAILQTLSPWHWFLGNDPVGTGQVSTGVLALGLATLVMAAAGSPMFERRDLMV